MKNSKRATFFASVPLKHAAHINQDTLSESTSPELKIDYVDISSVSRDLGIIRSESLKFSEAPSRARRRLRRDDVIISTVRTYLKAVARIGEKYEGAIASTGFAVLTPKPHVDPGFLSFAIQSDEFLHHVVRESTGVSYPAISSETLARLKLPIPDLDSQRSVSIFVDHETARIDVLIEKKAHFIALLKEKRAAVITHAVTKGVDPDAPMKDSGVGWLGRIPAHWEVRRISTLFREVFRKGNPELPVLSVSIHDGVTEDELADEDRDRRVALSEDRTKYQGVEPDDLVYNMMRAWQGAFGAVAVKGLVSPAYAVSKPIANMRTKFVEYVLRTGLATEEIRRFSRGIADFRMRLYWDHFRNMRIGLPGIDEQDRILRAIQEEAGAIDALISKTERSIELLREKRAALITAAVTGKIDVRAAA